MTVSEYEDTKPSCRVQCVVLECEGLLVGLDDCCTTTASIQESWPPVLRLWVQTCKWCLTMLGSNWMDREDAFFDYCSLHHQNSLTCLFMLRSENIVPVTITMMSLPCAGTTTKPRRHKLHRTTVYLSVTVASQSLIEKKQELSIPRPFFTSFWLDSWTVFENASDEQGLLALPW